MARKASAETRVMIRRRHWRAGSRETRKKQSRLNRQPRISADCAAESHRSVAGMTRRP
jgi:hypothetical protein